MAKLAAVMLMLCAPDGPATAGAAMSDRILEVPEPRCPKCSSLNTKPLSFNANATPYSVYACRACAHVWRLPRLAP